jgi:hypothetical protein
MANYYKLNASFDFRNDLLENEKSTLNYLLNGKGAMPGDLPAHMFFSEENKKNIISLPVIYKNFTNGEYHSDYWSTATSNGASLLLPGIRDLEGWYQTLKFVDWLCSMAQRDCFCGYICQEYDNFSISLLYSVKEKLYFKDVKELQGLNSFSTGEPL